MHVLSILLIGRDAFSCMFTKTKLGNSERTFNEVCGTDIESTL